MAPLVSHGTNKTSAVGSCEKHGNFEEQHTGRDIYECSTRGHGACTEAGSCIRAAASASSPTGPSRTRVWTGSVISASGRNIAFVTTRSLSPESQDGINSPFSGKLAAFRVEWEKAFARFYGPHRQQYMIPIVSEGGQWKINQVAPVAYPIGAPVRGH
ncbi:MAG TPA: hypothetical protein VND98_11975 [Solirubrobacterales bacterium]|nr:hypothetical protein [Solirubrobacterales bacterium]